MTESKQLTITDEAWRTLLRGKVVIQQQLGGRITHSDTIKIMYRCLVELVDHYCDDVDKTLFQILESKEEHG